MILELTSDEAVVVKEVLSKHAFDGSWFRRRETDTCRVIVTRINEEQNK